MNPGSGLLPSPAPTCWVFTWVLGGKLWQCRFITSPPICIVIQDSFLIPASHTGNKSFKSFLEVFFFLSFLKTWKRFFLCWLILSWGNEHGEVLFEEKAKGSVERKEKEHTISKHYPITSNCLRGLDFKTCLLAFILRLANYGPLGQIWSVACFCMACKLRIFHFISQMVTFKIFCEVTI